MAYSKPTPLFVLYYRHRTRTTKSSHPDNIIVVHDPDPTIDFESATVQARELFEKMCPGEDFLPPGPDPEEVEDFEVN